MNAKILVFVPSTLLKKKTVDVFSCEFCEIKNNYFIEHLRTTTSGSSLISQTLIILNWNSVL